MEKTPGEIIMSLQLQNEERAAKIAKLEAEVERLRKEIILREWQWKDMKTFFDVVLPIADIHPKPHWQVDAYKHALRAAITASKRII